MATARPLDDENTGLVRAGEKLVEQLLNIGINGFGPFKSAQESAAEALVNRTPDEAGLLHGSVTGWVRRPELPVWV